MEKTQLQSLNNFEFPSNLQTLVYREANVTTREGLRSFLTFTKFEFVAKVAFHADRINIRRFITIRQKSQDRAHVTTHHLIFVEGYPCLQLWGHKQVEKANLHARIKLESPKTANKLCLFHRTKTHTLNECTIIRELTFTER